MDGLRLTLEELDLDDEDLYKNAMYQGKPFTGTACGTDGQEEYEIPYENGMAHGHCLWRYSKSGKLSGETFAEHGQVIKSRSWYPPGDILYRDFDENGLRYYYRDGTLAIDRREGWVREYYPSGNLKNERIAEPAETRYVWYGEDGVWAVRWRQEAKDPGKRFPPDQESEYNDDYIRENFLKLLESAEDFGGLFFHWLFRDAPKKFPFRERDTSKLSAEGRKMVCAMIEYKDLRVKYRGITMAGQYQVEEARPLLEKAQWIREKPPGSWAVTGGGHEYAWTIGEAARNALAKLRKGHESGRRGT